MISKQSIRFVLTAKVGDRVKEKIVRDLKQILSFSSSPDSQPPDYYRMLGQCTVKLKLINELNKFINDQTSRYSHIVIWYKEMAQLREHTEKQISLCQKMIRGLMQEGIYTGFYEPPTEEKEHA